MPKSLTYALDRHGYCINNADAREIQAKVERWWKSNKEMNVTDTEMAERCAYDLDIYGTGFRVPEDVFDAIGQLNVEEFEE